MSPGNVRLIGDIGGTNARLAIAMGGTYRHRHSYPTAEHDGLEAVIAAFLAILPPELRPQEAAIAIAGPVGDDSIRMTNTGWGFTRTELARQFGFARLIVLNDFAAIALALPDLAAADTVQIGGGSIRAGAPIALLGPGTGLGVGGLLHQAHGPLVVLAGEGGHATMPAAEPGDAAILAEIGASLGHVSAERVLSGSGLVNLYQALCRRHNRPAPKLTPAEITDESSGDPLCHEAVALFSALLGTFAGNLALTLGAEGGVHIAGSIVPRLGPRFARSEFRRRFEAKGRMQPYLARIPSFVITHPDPALIGLARLPPP